jgi:general secretion pathway protein B
MAAAEDISRLPSWYELPQEFRNRLDLPRLDLHAYSEEPQNRFILVNLKKYREGERLESGLVLEEILPDGMVMSYQGERFLVER